MAALFLLAVSLIGWQALRIKPVSPPAFEIATKGNEQVTPVAVPSWHPSPDVPSDLSRRLAFLHERALAWPAMGRKREHEKQECRFFLRLSSQHWAERPASPALVQRWLERQEAGRTQKLWQLLYFPVASFLDDDDGDGDLLDDEELREVGPGAEVEVFCGEAAQTTGDRP